MKIWEVYEGWAIESSRLKEQPVQRWFKEQQGRLGWLAQTTEEEGSDPSQKGVRTVSEGNKEPPRTPNRVGPPAI